ncbi:cytochrome c5 [Legionella geestiana]|uniref:Cytochrome c5 n=1 Tax=Legionella geestiana TaxID=45065 RepID=A0A0W0U2H7_9GAMM|nr:c-type cytochrome [Legionella geestiana]KTD02334.1 cytochrome c5 [Legionella geestiana]QBS12191.1 cytochrome c5 family protein [Legionella geestiana]QDQ40095.1 cytochrome c5 family protein [Legionella geestiana]STX53080.1 cytochrome c5 [Legionella geestiana]
MRLAFFSTLLLLAVSVSGYALDNDYRSQVQQRIAPIGQVQVEGADVPAQPVTVAASPAVEKAPGEATYSQYCAVCHRDGIAGAPRFQNAGDWGARFKEKGLDGLLQSSIKGINAMPARGTCNDCTDADLKAAIEYMLPKS